MNDVIIHFHARLNTCYKRKGSIKSQPKDNKASSGIVADMGSAACNAFPQ